MTKEKTRVVTFLPNLEYIKLKRGEMGVNMVLEEMRRRGYNYDFRKMKKTEWVPIDVRKEFLEAVMDALGWDEKKIYQMGANTLSIGINVPQLQAFAGAFTNEGTSLANMSKIAPKMWGEYYSAGILRMVDLKPRYGKLIVENFDVSPLFCEYLRGFFTGLMKLLTKVKDLSVKETKCTFRGDEYHEYTIRWMP